MKAPPKKQLPEDRPLFAALHTICHILIEADPA